MLDRRFVALFLISFCVVLFSGFLYWKLFYIEQEIHQPQTGATYQEIDMIMPVEEFLKRGANSANVSMVKRVIVNQWIYFNQENLIKLIMYAQGATSFDELRKAFQVGIEKEPNNGAAAFIQGLLDAIAQDPQLIEHVNKSLKEGLSAQMHELRGKIMEVDLNSKEYKRLKNEYRKALYAWIDEKHGSLLDDLILQF